MRELSNQEVLAVAGGFSDDEPPVEVFVRTKRRPKDVIHLEENYWDNILENVAHQEAAEFLDGFDGGPSIDLCLNLSITSGDAVIRADAATSQFASDFFSMVEASGDNVQIQLPDGGWTSLSDVINGSGTIFIQAGDLSGGILGSVEEFAPNVWGLTVDLDAVQSHVDLPYVRGALNIGVFGVILHELMHIHTGLESTEVNEAYLNAVVLPAVQALMNAAGETVGSPSGGCP